MQKLVGGFLILLLLGYVANQVDAAKGVPGSPEFAIGTTLHTQQASFYNESLNLLAELRPDWIYLPVSWADLYALPDQPDFSRLDIAMKLAAERQIPVAVGLSVAPAWAMTAQGPDAGQTVQFALALANRYPGQIQALELFPRANTRQGWGSSANPAAYLALFDAVRQAFDAHNIPMVLVSAGLQPLSATPGEGDMNDLFFLQGLYDAGGKAILRVVSIQYLELTGEPLAAPSEQEHRILRHYEQVREVMLKNQHLNGLLWVTRVNLPSGSIRPEDAVYKDPSRQAEWLKKAHVQLRSQLYVGAVFLESVNTSDHSVGITSLIQANGTMHPFYALFKDMVYQNNRAGWVEKPGRPKNGNLDKYRQRE
jgi:hypothetical protein